MSDKEEDSRNIIKVGSRKSELALIQTKYVISRLQTLFPTSRWEIHTMTTVGDRVLNKSLPKIGEKSLFTKDLEEALTHGGVDFVVHSLKDLPTQLPTGMVIGAVLQREDPRDALVLNSKFLGHKLQTLPEGSLIGTSSLRRSAQLARNYTHLKVCDIRGNLNTRLAKLDAPQSKFSGIILANAGLCRMGWNKRIDQVIEPSELLYAVGQGALAVECRVNDAFILKMLSKLSDFKTQCQILTERSFLKTLGGGCSAPVGINSVITEITEPTGSPSKRDFSLKVNGGVWSLNGKSEVLSDAGFEFSVDAASTEPTSSDEDEFAESPSKRPRIIVNEDEKLKRSPEVIDESACPMKDESKVTEIVNIHGKVFDACPFSGKFKKNVTEGDASSETVPCPTDVQFDLRSMPIGLDVMGECPVLNMEQKVDFKSTESGSKGEGMSCPIVGHAMTSTNITDLSIKKCPYLSKQNEEIVQMFDYEENNKKNPNPEPKSLVEDLDDVKLYCGFFCHDKALKSVFNQCEDLGVSLAQKLIAAGALEIMKKAQDEIHSKC